MPEKYGKRQTDKGHAKFKQPASVKCSSLKGSKLSNIIYILHFFLYTLYMKQIMLGLHNVSLTPSAHHHTDETMKRLHGCKYQHCKSELREANLKSTAGPPHKSSSLNQPLQA